MNIVLTGSLGHITRPLAIKLLALDQAVTIVSSDIKKKSAIQSLGATPAIGSVTDTNFLTNTFTGADAVYCMTPPDFAVPDQIVWYEKVALSYADAIIASGVKRAVYLSSYGAHLPAGTGFITGSYRAEKILNVLPGVKVTHIRPTYFYYNLLAFTSMIKANGFIGSVYGGDDKLAMVAPTDIASAIVDEILRGDDHTMIRYVSSDDRTCTDIAKVLGEAIGIPNLTWNVLPAAQVMQALIGNGMPHDAAENLVALGLAVHSGVLREDYEKNKPVFGDTRLEEFATEFAAHYNKGNVQH